jgi:short-subunit dehydrogenase
MEFVVRVNTLAPMLVTRAFLPAMLALPEAYLLNMISVGGYATLPRAVVYTASKWGALGWSEGLAQELRNSGIRHVHVTSVFPGPISSGMFEGAKGTRVMPWSTPEQVARAAWEGMKARRAKVHVPRRLGMTPFLRGALPARAFYWLAGRAGVLDMMTGFKGARGD